MIMIRNFVFTDGVNNIGHKLFTGANETGNNLSPVSLLPAIKLLDVYQSAYNLKWTFWKISFYKCILQPNSF